MPTPTAEKINTLITKAQTKICKALESEDTKKFQDDNWTRPEGGGGRTKILEGSTFEKAGVNISNVHGKLTQTEHPLFQTLIEKLNTPLTLEKNAQWQASGISLIIHPKNPFIPTTHANYRYFELETGGQTIWWFGGGADLTPYYLDTEDVSHFHSIHKTACDKTDPNYYPEFKTKCDNYFYLPHRNEHRGIGGIFFDYLNDKSPETHLNMAQRLTEAFIMAYIPIVKKQKSTPYTEAHKAWQKIRRGRYVEFNLLHDKGTLFGLKTNGRIESIFASMPPEVSWKYNHTPEPGSPEEALLKALETPRDWV